MKTREQLRQCVQHARQLKARRRLATTRLADAEQERLWAIVAAHEAGLSRRQIATATGMSRSRIHLLLQDDEPHQILPWLSQLRPQDYAAGEEPASPPLPASLQARLAGEVEVLGWYRDWLGRRERGEPARVNLRPYTDETTEYVPFEHAWVRRVLAWIAAYRATLARHGGEAETPSPEQKTEPRARHRQRWATPQAQPHRDRTMQAQHEA